MIQNGFKKPQFFVRVDQGSPKPVGKLYERLYQNKDQKAKLLQKNREKVEKEKMKECTFAPVTNSQTNAKYLKKRQARSPNPGDAYALKHSMLIPEEDTQLQTGTITTGNAHVNATDTSQIKEIQDMFNQLNSIGKPQ